MSDRIEDHALVVGASMAGLLAARVLAEAYPRVTLVDPDELPSGPAQRRRVPQGRHAHALLARGQQALEELFPGLTDELVGRGAQVGDALGDVRMHLGGHRLATAATGLVALSASRPLLESAVRARVARLPGVRIAAPARVVGLTASADGRRVTGARVTWGDGLPEEVDANLVVDAAGRGSRLPAWLEELGHRRPAEERIRIGLGYATCLYAMPADALGGDLASVHGPSPSHPRGGVLARLERDRWMLTLAGVLGDHPPPDPDGMLEFARSLSPDVHGAVREARPLDEPVTFRFPASVRRRYDRVPRAPEGVLAVGDGVCSLNPIYGQGMTVAALSALALRRRLRGGRRPRPRRFHRDVARIVSGPWGVVAGGDLAFPAAEGRRTAALRLGAGYISRLHAAAARDPALARAFVRVSGLVDPPAALLRPRVAVGVLRHALAPRPGAPAARPEPAAGARGAP